MLAVFTINLAEMSHTFSMTSKPFSFNVCPYSVKMLMQSAHDFDLQETGKTYINLDVFMSGVGSNSCGPELAERYRAGKNGSNTFRIILKK